MKKHILIILSLFLTAFSTLSVMPPGWYQQTLPVNDFVNDIYFVDTLNGWVVTKGHPQQNDTGYIMRTSDGGNNWSIQFLHVDDINVINFVDKNIGYAGGGFGRAVIFKTTNGGISWDTTRPFGSNVALINDLQFVNADTGWICSTDGIGGGVFKTTNGGVSWIQQLNQTYKPLKIFFINKDTGWACNTDAEGLLYKTTNGGNFWSMIYTSDFKIESLFFLNAGKGWMRGGELPTQTAISYTTDGGFTWFASQGNAAGGFDIKFINDSVGYAGSFSPFPRRIMKSIDGGKTWGYQLTPLLSANLISVLKNDTSNIWAGNIMHTKMAAGK